MSVCEREHTYNKQSIEYVYESDDGDVIDRANAPVRAVFSPPPAACGYDDGD